MRIVFDARMYGYENSGIGRYIVNLVDELSELDRKNKYFILLRSKYFSKINFPDNWKKIEADFRHYSVKEQLKLGGILKSVSPDLVHFPHFNVPIFYKGKYIVTIHDLSMHKRSMASTTLPFWLYFVKRVGYQKVFSRAVWGSARIIVPSRYVLGELVKKYPFAGQKSVVIYEGVDKKFYTGSPAQGLLKSLKIEKPYFLYVGNAYPHKNVTRAIEAVSALNLQGVKVSLVIVTPRNVFEERLKEVIKSKNAGEYVKLLGFLPDEKLMHLYHHAASFVYPSKEEGFGLPGLEAMATKTLVLASDIPVFKEVYKNNAVFFNPHDFSSIQSAMREALFLSRTEKIMVTDKAYEFSKRYSWTKTAEETLQIYENSAGL